MFMLSNVAKWPTLPKFFYHRDYCKNKRADERSRADLMRCQRGSTRDSRAGRISCDSASVTYIWSRWYDFLYYSKAMSALQCSYLLAMIQSGQVCSKSRPSRWLQTWLLALKMSPSLLWHVCFVIWATFLEDKLILPPFMENPSPI